VAERSTGRLAVFILVLVLPALAACDGDSDGGGAGEGTAQDSTGPRKSSGCRPGADPTPEQTEGPYYKAGPPRRSSLLDRGVAGRELLLRGRVLSEDCRPLAGARVDFWQADGEGAYDNDGYRLRGYQRTDGKGRYRLETVVPGQYEGRTRHIHVKVTPQGGTTLTTQLYFPGEAGNRSDAIFDPATVLRLRRGGGDWRASFDFVVEPG
jgi:protocatechuate 3,4-dioxygenase beta subunit